MTWTIAWAADALRRGKRAILNLVVEYAKVRAPISGRPIGAFQAVQHLCVDMLREQSSSPASGVIHALWAADAGSRAERHSGPRLRTKAFRPAGWPPFGDTAIQVLRRYWLQPGSNDAQPVPQSACLSWSAFLSTEPDQCLVQIGAQVRRVRTSLKIQ